MCVISVSRSDLCVPWTAAISRSALATDLSALWMLWCYLSDTGVLPASFSCFASVYLYLLYGGSLLTTAVLPTVQRSVSHQNFFLSEIILHLILSSFWFIIVNVYAVWLKITTGNRGEEKRVHKTPLLSKSVRCQMKACMSCSRWSA